jgi:hypothetical protein
MSILEWMNDQFLRMVWLNDLVGRGVAAVGLDPDTRLGESVQFFVYDVIKIFLLLSVLIEDMVRAGFRRKRANGGFCGRARNLPSFMDRGLSVAAQGGHRWGLRPFVMIRPPLTQADGSLRGPAAKGF